MAWKKEREDKELSVNKIDVETAAVYGVKDSHDKLVWFPKSQVTCRPRHPNGFILTVPAWLAEQRDSLVYED
jgi:hypothetical protein